MHGTHLIEVANKPGIRDPLAAALADDLKHLGVPDSCQVTTSRLYRLVGQLSPEDRARIGGELLADPVTEEFHDGGWKPKEPVPGMERRKRSRAKSVVVDVWYKSGVTDAVGGSVLKGLRDLNLEEITDVRTGMRYRFIGLKDSKTAERLALAALMNPLIHERTIHAD